MPLSVFLGRALSETRTVEHPDGSVTTVTTVHEPLWDDDSRAAALALHDDEADRCTECGGPRDECSDPAISESTFPQRAICYRSMEREAAARRYSKIHEERPFHDGTFTAWAKEASTKYGYHHDDGVRIYTAPFDVNPSDDFLTDRREGGEFGG